MLVLADADGREGPVFKSFATILPFEVTDCKGRTSQVPLWAPVSTWREQTDTVREALRRDFDRVLLLADSSDLDRVARLGLRRRGALRQLRAAARRGRRWRARARTST